MIYTVYSGTSEDKKVEHITPVWEEARLRALSLSTVLGIITVIGKREVEGGAVYQADLFVPDNLAMKGITNKYGYVIYFERDKPIESSLWLQWSYEKPMLISEVLVIAKAHRDSLMRGWRVANVVPGWKDV